MSTNPDLTTAIARILTFPQKPPDELTGLVKDILGQNQAVTRADLEALQQRIEATPGATNLIGLVYGGATKIKGYVFEAPKLPEIRGASALLDWVNEHEVRRIWREALGPDLGEQAIIYASGGNFLAFAPAALAQNLATLVERSYTAHTLTANSAAVAASFQLLELRFGRNPLGYWTDEFLRDCKNTELKKELLAYYYPPEGLVANDSSDEALSRRFLNRKSFGELVTVLATRFNRRRDERASNDEHASHGEPRSLPRFELSSWAAKCQSSDVRPAIVTAQFSSDDTDSRLLSEPSARKLASGRVVKGKGIGGKLEQALKPWPVPGDLASQSWEQRWEKHLESEGRESPYAQAQAGRRAEAASDVGEIGAASDPSRYIGLIYADGNNIGRLMATLTSPQIYQEVSRALTDVAQHAVFTALAQHLAEPTGHPREIHPFEILAIGGDDLFIVVPGDRAFDVALTIAQTFEAELTKRFEEIARKYHDFALPQRAPIPELVRYHGPDALAQQLRATAPVVGLSAGVLIAQENAPFFFLRDLVEELLKRAKKLARANASATNEHDQPKPRFYGGAVDFMALKSTTMVTDKIGPFREAALNDHKASKRRLTARPYSWAELAGLLTTIRALKAVNVPRSQLYRLRRTLDQDTGEGVLTSVMEYLYTRSRQRERIASALMEHVEGAWCLGRLGSPRRVGMPPWSPMGDQGYETVWPDLIEAWEFVARSEVK